MSHEFPKKTAELHHFVSTLQCGQTPCTISTSSQPWGSTSATGVEGGFPRSSLVKRPQPSTFNRYVLERFRPLQVFRDHKSQITSLTFDDVGTTLLSTAIDNTLYMYCFSAAQVFPRTSLPPRGVRGETNPKPSTGVDKFETVAAKHLFSRKHKALRALIPGQIDPQNRQTQCLSICKEARPVSNPQQAYQSHSGQQQSEFAADAGHGDAQGQAVVETTKEDTQNVMSTVLRLWDLKENRFQRTFSMPEEVNPFLSIDCHSRRPLFVVGCIVGSKIPHSHKGLAEMQQEHLRVFSLRNDRPILTLLPRNSNYIPELPVPRVVPVAISDSCTYCLLAVGWGPSEIVIYEETVRKEDTKLGSTDMDSPREALRISLSKEILWEEEEVCFLKFSPNGTNLLVGTSLSSTRHKSGVFRQYMVINLQETSTTEMFTVRRLISPIFSEDQSLHSMQQWRVEGEDGELASSMPSRPVRYLQSGVMEPVSCPGYLTLGSRMLQYQRVKYGFPDGSKDDPKCPCFYPSWTPCSGLIAIGLPEGGFATWNAVTGKEVLRFQMNSVVKHIAISPTETLLATSHGVVIALWTPRIT